MYPGFIRVIEEKGTRTQVGSRIYQGIEEKGTRIQVVSRIYKGRDEKETRIQDAGLSS